MSINSFAAPSRLLVACSIVASLGACASDQSAASSSSTDTEQAVTYTATAEEAALIKSDQPLPPGPIVMYMNGLSCPLCATNIDQQVEKLPGVSDVKVDLSTGKVKANLTGPQTPSPKQLSTAADAAGVTLIKIAR
ncbi:MAG: heavy-metal-associated domain-containing protein [Phycisphaerae bacterium]|nr:heavy-metal-associated domain-containing protein [Phycisphaerae bacterium]